MCCDSVLLESAQGDVLSFVFLTMLLENVAVTEPLHESSLDYSQMDPSVLMPQMQQIELTEKEEREFSWMPMLAVSVPH